MMGGDNLYCSQCNVTMTGTEQYTQHMAGRKHLKKLKALGLVPTTQGPSVAPSQTASAPVTQGYVPSRPPAVGRSQVAISQPVDVQPGQGTYEYVSGISDPVMNAVKANMMGKLPTKRVAYEGRCDVCNVQYTSATHETQHMSGQKHLKKIQMAEGGGLNAATFFCSFCNVRVNSPQQMDQHRLGTTHKKKVEKAQQESGTGPSPAKKLFVPSSKPTPAQQFAMPPPAPLSTA